MKHPALLILAIFALSNLTASQQKVTATCANNSGTQAEANACARVKSKQADDEMKQVYEQLLSELSNYGSDGKAQQKLKQAQSAWLQYRDANCESEASIYEGGSIRPAVYYFCRASITQERTARIKEFLNVTRQ